MSDVYVLGVDMIKFGRFPDRTVPDLGAEAALLAPVSYTHLTMPTKRIV